MLLVTDVFLLLTQVLLWILVGLAARFILLQALPKAFLGYLVMALLVIVTGLTFFSGTPEPGVLGDIWQLISVIFNPLAIILIMFGVAWWDFDKGKGLTNTSKQFLRVGIIALLIMSLPVVSNFMVQRSEMEAIAITQPENTALPPGARRVIVLMGQDTTKLQVRPRTQNPPTEAPLKNAKSGWLQPAAPMKEGTFGVLSSQAQLTEHGDRIIYAAQLYRQEAANNPVIIVSAGQYQGRERKGNETRESTSAAVDISRILQAQLGIPGTGILVDANGYAVQNSAVNVRKLLEAQQINYGDQLMIVTSALEASRTALTFQNEFSFNARPVTVINRPTDFYSLPARESLGARTQGQDLIERGVRLGDFLPSVDALQTSSKWLNETLTSLYYFLRGWIRPLRPG
jgi:uncharacterized SAM-binding protein YcdF (DUF218 family)